MSQVSAVWAQQIPVRTIEVQGIGVMPVEPNGAYLDVGLQSVSTNLPESYREAREQLTRITESVVALGVAAEDVRLQAVTITPEDRLDERAGAGPSGEFLFRTQIVVRITIRQFALVDAVIQTAIDVGANTVRDFVTLYDDLTTAEDAARTEALANARQRAQVIADSYGLVLSSPVTIEEQVTTGVSPTLRADATSGRFNVTVVVTATFEVQVAPLP
jgi:hypothetical protein